MIDKYVNRTTRKYLFVCFIDFKAAFDSIWRQALFYKLSHLDIGGNFLRTTQSMYSNVQYSVNSIYMHVFPDIFDSTCDPVTLKDSNLSCIMFADDVVLMSESSQGLQPCLNRLASYCNKWNLTINTPKTKITIFNRDGHKILRFNFFAVRYWNWCRAGLPLSGNNFFVLGAVSIRKTVLPGMAIPMLKIRRPNGRLIFNMEITIRR